MVVATDVRERRMRTLRSTLSRCGADHVRLAQISATADFPFKDGTFDAVLVDAPCSGLGTVRRDPDIKWKRLPEDLATFARAQLVLLRRASRVVRPGGRLVYSTCSSEPDENEAVVDAFVAGAPQFILQPLGAVDGIAPGLRRYETSRGCFRTDPARDGLEPFFAATLRHVVR
jgi:16S rRNA (cytosine967-C5)-methyltransferase